MPPPGKRRVRITFEEWHIFEFEDTEDPVTDDSVGWGRSSPAVRELDADLIARYETMLADVGELQADLARRGVGPANP
jgi:hypothetical protein